VNGAVPLALPVNFMRARSDMDRTSFHLPLAALILVTGTVAALLMPNVPRAVLVTAAAAIIAAIVALLGDSDVAAQPHPAVPAPQQEEIRGLFDLPAFHTLIDSDSRAIIGLVDMRIALANESALALLGRHIGGVDVRTAIRHPAVIDALLTESGPGPDPVNLVDFMRSGDRWQLSIVSLGSGQRLLLLDDRSALDAAERMRSDFVANASHELRTPLAAILGYVETLEQLGSDDDEAVRQRFLSIIDREARRMQQLVADLISISRIEADRYRRPTAAVDLAEVVRAVRFDIANTAPERASDISADLPATAPMTGDGAQLTQLAHNIIGNAMKYGRTGTPLTITLIPEATGWRFTVEDVGDGIAPDHLPRLTERFYRVDDARSRAVGGTGLGLAIVKHIAERHRARLTIDSEVGKGTKVSLYFPGADS
jgi:two-component system, OmpR family, phosphate regulon sensor histidine kinase PhoR